MRVAFGSSQKLRRIEAARTLTFEAEASTGECYGVRLACRSPTVPVDYGNYEDGGRGAYTLRNETLPCTGV